MLDYMTLFLTQGTETYDSFTWKNCYTDISKDYNEGTEI